MKKKLLRFFVIVMAVLMALCCVGCREDGGGTDKNTIKISYLKAGFGSKWIDDLAKKFMEENPGTLVKLEGDYQMPSMVSSRMESQKNLSDIFYAQSGVWQQWVVKGWIEPLDDVYSAQIDDTTYVEKMQPGIRDLGKLYDHYYAVPINDNVTGFVYNAKLFRDKGWEVPKTMSEMEDLIAKIKKDGSMKPFVFCGNVAGGYWDFPLVTWWAQYEGIENMNTFMEFGSPDIYKQTGRLKALEALYSILSDDTNYVTGCMGFDNIQAQSALVRGEAAMVPCASYFETEMSDILKENPDFEAAMMPYPSLDDAQTDDNGDPIRINYTCGGEVFFIPKGAANKELAKEFLKFMAREDNLQEMLLNMGTPQPFQFDTESVYDQMSAFGKSCLDIWKNSYNLTIYSDSPLYLAGKVGLWPTPGFHQSRMVTDPVSNTARACYQKDIDLIEANWDTYCKEVGLS